MLKSFKIRAIKEKTAEIETPSSSSSSSSVDEVTKKYGLEVGLWKIFSSKEEDEGKKSKSIGVQPLLQKVGISTEATGEKVGTFALAYAAHKAASPIRFPPTVALTPIVASWIGKMVEKDN
ncbi:hypothetical protein PTKIN_Ptkin03bG0072400 [Pterospermum kingtungense]